MSRGTELLPERSANVFEGAGSKPLKTHLTEERKAAIKLEDGSLIQGIINIMAEPAHEHHDSYTKHGEARDTFYKRVSDIFTKGKNPFIVVFDASLEGQTGKVLIINKHKILWVSPED